MSTLARTLAAPALAPLLRGLLGWLLVVVLCGTTLAFGNGQLSIESKRGNITGQSAQLAGDKVLLLTTKADPAKPGTGGGSIDLQSLQVAGKTVGVADAANGTSALITQTVSTVQGSIKAANGVTLSANQDITLGAQAIDAGSGNLHAQAGGNLTLGANADFEQRNQSSNRTSSSLFTRTTTTGTYQAQEGKAAVTTLQGADISLQAGDTLTNYAAQIQGSGTVTQIAGNDARTYTAKEYKAYSENIQSSTSLLGLVEVGKANSSTTTLDTTQLGSKIFATDVGIQAKNVDIVGADIAAKNQLTIKASDSVNIKAATNTASVQHSESRSEVGLTVSSKGALSLDSSAQAQDLQQQSTTHAPSTLGGANVTIQSGGNTTVSASRILADDNLTITAGKNLAILAQSDTQTQSEQTSSRTTSIGLVGDVFGRSTFLGHTTSEGASTSTSTQAATSVLSANKGSLSLSAQDGTLTAQGATLLAQDKVTLVGKDIDLQAVTHTSQSDSHFETNSFSVGAALAGTVGSKVTAIGDTIQTGRDSNNDRLKAASALKAGYDTYKLASGGIDKATADAATFRQSLGANANSADPNSGAAIGVSVSVNIGSTQQSSASTSSTVQGTTIQAQDIAITATGGNLTATAAKIEGQSISLEAAKDINLVAGVNTTTLKSSSESHNVGAGVTVGIGQQSGISFQLSAGQGNANANGSETTFDNTRISATNTLSVKSGANTNLVGAQLAGNSVKMDVGGDLNIVTLQDKSTSASEQHSSGLNLSLCIPPLCYGNMVSGSISKSDASFDHNYQSATGQSGIVAGNKDGSGGYTITVKGNTDLVGGAITSSAPNPAQSHTDNLSPRVIPRHSLALDQARHANHYEINS